MEGWMDNAEAYLLLVLSGRREVAHHLLHTERLLEHIPGSFRAHRAVRVVEEGLKHFNILHLQRTRPVSVHVVHVAQLATGKDGHFVCAAPDLQLEGATKAMYVAAFQLLNRRSLSAVVI